MAKATKSSATPPKATSKPKVAQKIKASPPKSKKATKPLSSGASKSQPKTVQSTKPKDQLKLGLFQWGESKSGDSSLKVIKPTQKAGPPSLAKVKFLAALWATSRMKTVTGLDLWGLMPADFVQRTGMSGDQLRTTIVEHPGFDLYYCSAHPEVEAVYHNPWRAPQVTHPNFIDLSRKFLRAAGLNDAPVDTLCHSTLFATGNLLVATPSFWKGYIDFVERAFDIAYSGLDATTKKEIFEEIPSPGRMTIQELIAARMMGIYLMSRGLNFKAYKIPLMNQEKSLNTHLQFLRELKDFAIENRSRWHVAAWINYRGLYLAHVMGKEWINKHIDEITPGSVKIAIPTVKVSFPYPRALQDSHTTK